MLLERIRRHAQAAPQRVAYRCGGQSLCYGQLWRQAAHLAARLRGGRGPVLVFGHKSAEMPVAFLACLLAGRPYLPCDHSMPPHRLAQVWQAAGAKLALACEPLPPLPGPLPGRVLRPQQLAALPEAEPAPQNGPQEAYWAFTSGSTGVPKGVRVTLENLEHFTAWMLAQPAIADCAGGVCVNQALFSFDLSAADLWPALAAGGSVYALPDRLNADLPALYRALGQSGAERLSCTPSFARLCLCDAVFARQLMPRLKTVFLCGEVLPPRTARALARRFEDLRILNAYGPTEAACAVCAVEVQAMEPGADVLPVGRLHGAAAGVRIVSETGRPLAEGQVGEICLIGPSVAAGYCNAPPGGFCSLDGQRAYRTGDLGRCSGGLLWYHGRKDRQIKYKGYRIEPGEVEAALLALPGVRAAAVLPLRRGMEVTGLAACIDWAGRPFSAQECTALLRDRLPAYMCPARYAAVSPLPLTPNGKTDLARLEERLQHGT